MSSSTQVSRIMGVTSKPAGSGTIYQITVEGFRKPLETWKADIAKQAADLNGQLANVAYTTKPETFTNAEGRVINFNKFYLDGVQAVEPQNGETNLDQVLAPQAQTTNDRAVATAYVGTTGAAQSPSDAVRQADIRRAVAFKGAVEYAVAMMQAGEAVTLDGIQATTDKFQSILESR